jgi:tripartite-type tricarboxylate transporter receptor subunit TctC
MLKRLTINALLLCLAALTGASVAAAQDYPNRPVRIIIGFPAGGATDVVTRIFADKLSERFKAKFLVENMPGASSNNAAGAVARAQPDGYTLLVATNTNTTNVSLSKNLRFGFPGDFAPVGMLATAPVVLAVSADLNVKSVRELIAAAKARPGEIMYGSAGVGTGGFMAAELLNMMAGLKLTHVPYKGTNEAVADLLTGRISVILPPAPIIAGFIGDSRLNVLAVTSEKRTEFAPELPTIAESGVPGFDVRTWSGLVAPKETPAPILKQLADAIEEIAAGDDVKRRLAAAGADALALSLDRFGEFMTEEIPKWARVIEFAGVTPQ